MGNKRHKALNDEKLTSSLNTVLYVLLGCMFSGLSFISLSSMILSYCHWKICFSTLFRPDSFLSYFSVNHRSRKLVDLTWCGYQNKTLSMKFSVLMNIFQTEIFHANVSLSTHWVHFIFPCFFVFNPLKPFRHLGHFRFTLNFSIKNCVVFVCFICCIFVLLPSKDRFPQRVFHFQAFLSWDTCYWICCFNLSNPCPQAAKKVRLYLHYVILGSTLCPCSDIVYR